MKDNEKRLLVLDDDQMTANTIGFIAQSAGIASRVTTNSDTFFKTVESWDPTHIALDLIMPEMDGVEVMVELARLKCRSRIIITSGVGSRVLDAAGRSAREHGLDIVGELSKPFSPSELRKLLEDGDTRPKTAVEASGHYDDAGIDLPDEAELRAGLDLEELRVRYQPKIHCSSGKIAGFEALVRWQNPKRGLLTPAYFIPLAEQTGLIEPLTRVVLEKSLNWFSESFTSPSGKVDSDDANDLTLSINISARSVGDPAFIDHLVERCSTLGIHPEQLIFELTETSAMEDPVGSLDLLTRLRMKGFQLSIDDFGTGYSSMLQLVRLPFSEIKVDRSFVMTAARSEESRAVIRSIMNLGHSLGLQTTAEGVEDEETLQFLRGIHCDLAQGYYISQPMNGEDACNWAIENLESTRSR